MNRVERSLCAVAALALAVIGVMLARGLLPSRVEAAESGRLVPWLMLWGLAWVAAIAAVAVAGLLLAAPPPTK
jgi:peptidoglycan biosynthesis protein MviN/MurJ (putative lipid II flippase)